MKAQIYSQKSDFLIVKYSLNLSFSITEIIPFSTLIFCSLKRIIQLFAITFFSMKLFHLYGKNGFAKRSKILAEYRSQK